MNNKYSAKVINIPDRESIIIDFGRYDNAEKGQKVRVIEKGPEILGLNQEVIGTLDAVKTEMEIVTVYDNFSVCQRFVTETIPSPIFSISQIALPSHKTYTDTINVNEEEISNISPPKISPISVGDSVEIFDNN